MGTQRSLARLAGTAPRGQVHEPSSGSGSTSLPRPPAPLMPSARSDRWVCSFRRASAASGATHQHPEVPYPRRGGLSLVEVAPRSPWGFGWKVGQRQ
eukprot:6427317-Alexandrium_andersonii.AAC.1